MKPPPPPPPRAFTPWQQAPPLCCWRPLGFGAIGEPEPGSSKGIQALQTLPLSSKGITKLHTRRNVLMVA